VIKLFKVFGTWDTSDVKVGDAGLERHINIENVYLPHSGGRHAKKPFGKSEVSIVERLINRVS
jgi:small subunit ribosomal protein S7